MCIEFTAIGFAATLASSVRPAIYSVAVSGPNDASFGDVAVGRSLLLPG